jgi:hypothetical protein
MANDYAARIREVLKERTKLNRSLAKLEKAVTAKTGERDAGMNGDRPAATVQVLAGEVRRCARCGVPLRETRAKYCGPPCRERQRFMRSLGWPA